MIIVYIHGYKSNGESNTLKLIRENYNCKVVSPTYNTSNAYQGNKELFSQIQQVLKEDQEVYLVGSSLGGFWANYYSNLLALPVLLINPCLDPVNILKKYIETDSDLEVDSYKKYYLVDMPGIPKLVVLGKEDKLIPYESFMNRFNNRYSIFINDNMKHRVSTIEEIKPALDQLINNSIG